MSGSKILKKDKMKYFKLKNKLMPKEKSLKKKQKQNENEEAILNDFYFKIIFLQTFYFQEESLWQCSVYWCYLKYLTIFFHKGELQQYENQ